MSQPSFNTNSFANQQEPHGDAIRDNLTNSALMREALQEFVDRVDKGEISSKYHYKKFKDLLSS